jgi:hypothetical protein
MHIRFLGLLAALLCVTVASTGCIINNANGQDDEPRPGDVSFIWTFSGASARRCSDVPEVKSVRISIPGQSLANGGLQPCGSEGVDGTILRNVAPGIYNYTVEALGDSGQVLYSGSGSFSVDGNAQVSVTLTPVGHQPASGDVSFLWAFSGSSTRRCADVPEVKSMRITIPGRSLANGGVYACNSVGVDGVTLRAFAPGSYGYTVEALGGTGQLLYSGSGSFTVDGDTRVNVSLDPSGPRPGDVTFVWSFSGSPIRHCADVPDVKSIRITIPGQVLANGGVYACSTAGVDGIALLAFAPGAYGYTVEARGDSGAVLYSGSGSFTVNGNTRVDVSLEPVGPRPGDVTFVWRFSGAPVRYCADVPDVKSIHITIPGQVLMNGGVYPCNTAGVDGIALRDFAPGSYSYTVEALGDSGAVLFSGSGSFTVNGDTRVDVSLAPSGGANSYALISWTFPANTTSSNPTCAQAGVVSVDIRIDGGAWSRLECVAGSGGGSVRTPLLAQGQHALEFIALSGDGRPYYSRQGTLETRTGSPVSVSYVFSPVGGMALKWQLLDGSAPKSCADAGVTSMLINLKDKATGVLVYGDSGDPRSCEGAPVIYQYLRPGSYEVYIRGMKGSTIAYSNEFIPPTLTVTAFEQKTGADAVTLTLTRQ